MLLDMHLKEGYKVRKETQRSQRSILFFMFIVILRVLSGLRRNTTILD
jgi:hypothetical protein